ncbi:MAG: HNH endonuclease [Nonomuraea sp.]|nr:HNH endonuclease [Nonomuraea sp.]
MSKTYTGIPDALRQEVLERDGRRCRWCGATNRGADLHHIEYRRGYSYDRVDNLITLCRLHHGFVHGTPAKNGATITKAVAQIVLGFLVEHPGTTGLSTWRAFKRRWALDGLCEKHAVKRDECQDCAYENRRG